MISITKGVGALALALALVFASGHARAGGPPGAGAAQVERPSMRPLALAAELGWHKGAAVGAELRLGMLAARVTAGGNLVPLVVQDPTTYSVESITLLASGQFNADALFFPIRTPIGAEVGVSGGYRFNTVLGRGFAGAVEVRRQLKQSMGLFATLGLSFYPEGEERAIEKEDFRPDVKFNFPFGAGVQLGLGVGLTYDL